jgi:hypothetical protein
MTNIYTGLDYFGQQLVTQVRDAAFSDADQTLERSNTAPSRQEMLSALARFSQDDIKIVRKLVREEIDNTIHHLLWWLEREALNEEQYVKVDVKVGGHTFQNIAEVSDGLSGEYEGEEGWVALFSKYPARQEPTAG